MMGWASLLVHYEELRSVGRKRAMRFRVVCDLIAHASLQNKTASIFQFCVEFPRKTEEDMALRTPVISEVAR
jgi:hypothetical protein